MSTTDSHHAQQIEVIAAIRRAFEKFKHHQTFTRRVKPILEAELPGYAVSVDLDHFGLHTCTIRVWGKGLPYDNGSVYLCWNGSKPWAEGMAEAIEISDMRDYAEREEQEKTLEDKLAELHALVEHARAEAEALVAALPVPTSATIRKNHPTWQGPTGSLRKAFPLLFESVVDSVNAAYEYQVSDALKAEWERSR